MTAATSTFTTIATRRCFASESADTTPMSERKARTTGTSNTTPKPRSIASTSPSVELIVSIGERLASFAMASIAGNAGGMTRK